MKRNTLKFLSLMASILLVAALALGCAATPTADANATTAASQASQAPEQTTAPQLSGDAITDSDAKVYMIIPNSKIARYSQFDAPNVQKHMAKFAPNIKLTILDSEGNPQKQLQQVESAIADGCEAMILLPVDSNTAGGMLSMLAEEDILTLTYAHEGFGGPVDYHITTPFPTIASQHAEMLEKTMKDNPLGRPYRIAQIWGQTGFAFYEDLKNTYAPFIQKWEAEGLAEVVYTSDTDGWSAEVSQPVAEQCLTELENNVDVIMTMNDDLATGIIAALNAQGLAGKVKVVGGCDATLEGIARVQVGWQEADIAMDYDSMAKAAATIIAHELADKELPAGLVNGTFDNKFVDGGVPAAYIDSLLVTKDKISSLIVDVGMYTQAQIDELANKMK